MEVLQHMELRCERSTFHGRKHSYYYAAEPKGKNFRLITEIVRTIPGLGIHPNIVPRKKKLSDVKQGEDDNPDALFDVDGFDPDSNSPKSSGLSMDSTTLLCLLVVLQNSHP